MTEIGGPVHYASADEPLLKDRAWILQQWEIARTLSVQRRRTSALLVLDEEVDFILNQGKKLTAIEFKFGATKSNLSGMATFSQEFKRARMLLVGHQGIPLEMFLTTPPEEWVE
jgi:hypothetical protein